MANSNAEPVIHEPLPPYKGWYCFMFKIVYHDDANWIETAWCNPNIPNHQIYPNGENHDSINEKLHAIVDEYYPEEAPDATTP